MRHLALVLLSAVASLDARLPIGPVTAAPGAAHPPAHTPARRQAQKATPAMRLRLIPYPQVVRRSRGALPLGPARCVTYGLPSATMRIAVDSLRRLLPGRGRAVRLRLGSREEGYEPSWLSPAERAFLAAPTTSPEAYVLKITRDGITVVGRERWGMLYGVQTVNQLLLDTRGGRGGDAPAASLPCLTIRDWPAMPWRCLAPALTWYSGWNRLEGYDLCNWGLGEWKWLVDWSLLHKCNAWAVCMYGYWPFALPGFEESTLRVDSFFMDPATGRKTPWRFIHPNIRKEFFPEVIRYANARGIAVHAYIGKNSFNGGYILRHAEANAGGAAEMHPCHPAFRSYVDAFFRRILELGFNGFVLEDPEAYHVPCLDETCYRTFWEPWADTYGFSSPAQVNPNAPPLGVHVEYYTWLFRQFDEAIQRHARRLGRTVEVHLISHFLLSRVMAESRTPEERTRWLNLIDQKQGRKVHYIVAEANEKAYVQLLGGDRVASLGGRGGACTCAMRRIASVNNNWEPGGMGTGVDYERDCQRRIHQAGGNGAMGYIFEWRLNEIFGYVAAQHLWRPEGVPGIDNENQTGFLDYAYRAYYGDEVGRLVARALDEGSNVNEAMVLEGVYGSQYPNTGQPLHRDYQLLAARADRAARLALLAYRRFTGARPDLERALYPSDKFRWNGYDATADRLFKAETLRRLCVSTRRSQWMCEAALAHRLAQRLIADGAPLCGVLRQLDRAIAAARANQRLYQVNYDDDYDWTDGLCVRVTDRLVAEREALLAAAAGRQVHAWDFARGTGPQGWTAVNHMTVPVVEHGELRAGATGEDPFLVQAGPLSIPVSRRHFVSVEMASSKAGRAELFWITESPGAGDGPRGFREPPAAFEVRAGEEPARYLVAPPWEGTLVGLRLDIPEGARIRLCAIRILHLPEELVLSPALLARPLPQVLRRGAAGVARIPWEKQTDLLPARRTARAPGRYLSVALGLNTQRDTYCLGIVFTVQARGPDGAWRTLFRRALDKNCTTWERWDVPLPAGMPERFGLRLLTDSYSRARDRTWPSWRWALWGNPRVVEVQPGGRRRVLYDLTAHAREARHFVRLDTGFERPFDGRGADSTGATFCRVDPGPVARLRQGEGRAWQWVEGFAQGLVGGYGAYPCYLGTTESWWRHRDPAYYLHPGEAEGDLAWLTQPMKKRAETAVAFVGGTSYSVSNAELWCDGRRLVGFRTGSTADTVWREGGVSLRFYFGGDTRDARTPYGLSGLFVLKLPAALVRPGAPLRLTVKLVGGAPDGWFMVHGYRRALNVAGIAALPEPPLPTIAAYTPHRGAFGITGADFDLKLPGAR